MSVEKNIKTFTATDIEKYWTGKLSNSEMHAMEKAALDDPFLADAMEGYQSKPHLAGDLNTLTDKLDKRVIVPVVPLNQKRFPWLKIAAAIIIIGGIGVLIQQLVLSNKNDSHIAISTEIDKKKTDMATDSINSPAVPATTGDIQGSLQSIRPDSLSLKTHPKVSDQLQAMTVDDKKSTDTLNFTTGLAAAESKKTEEAGKDSTSGNAVANADAERLTEKSEKRSLDKPGVNDTAKFRNANAFKTDAAAAPKAKFSEGVAAGRNFAADFTNRYNYRVVDAQNNPVPFANVMNTGDNVGTYTDIRGNFNLVSSDSVLNVQIKSLGYLSNNYKLIPSNQFKSLTLQEDFYARRKILDSSRQLVSNAARKDTAELEEPEVGWGYFNTYVANNIQLPDNIRKKTTLSNVELSFDVDKTGQPVNIKVAKSSQCKECDDEAIRLLKEGPKWKKKGRRSRTTISIAVDQK